MRIAVDADACQGYGHCCFAAPEVFDLGDEGPPAHPAEVGEDARAAVERAARDCPVRAIGLTG